jgi:hypothetical protein
MRSLIKKDRRLNQSSRLTRHCLRTRGEERILFAFNNQQDGQPYLILARLPTSTFLCPHRLLERVVDVALKEVNVSVVGNLHADVAQQFWDDLQLHARPYRF